MKNPKGARCTMWDTNVATFGRDPLTGFARRSLDNVGVQYGLEALNRGAITDGGVPRSQRRRSAASTTTDRSAPERSVADPESLRLTYVAGRLNSGAGGLATTPILHYPQLQRSDRRHPRSLPRLHRARASAQEPTAASTTR